MEIKHVCDMTLKINNDTREILLSLAKTDEILPEKFLLKNLCFL